MVPMSSEGSVSHWIDQLRAGDPAAAECLWGRYFERLVALARIQLRGTPRRAADEEDVALSAFDSFCRGVERGRFPELLDRNSLWRLLVTITLRKANALRRGEHRQKRGGGGVVGESELPELSNCAADAALEQVMSRELTPELAVQVAEECRRLLGVLNDAALQSLALLKMEGYTNDELAVRLGYSLRTVERKLRLIRTLWKEQSGA
jgi:DNA-directed RNA polymerase specialized sigma24 family protein